MSSMICYECQKLWFGAGARSRATCECPDCGSRLMLSEATRRSEPQGAAAR
jgi:DNA-directed RNA polymerase subunit RPC12/RpoP